MLDPNTLFSGNDFIAYSHYDRWQTPVVWLHLVSDSAIALADYSISVVLIYFVRQRQDLPFRLFFWLFGAFLVAYGTAHLLAVWTVWYPLYGVSGGLKLLTAVLALATVFMLLRLCPQALSLPSAAQWESANVRLQIEIAAHERAEADLRADKARLREAQRIARMGDWNYDLLTQTITWSESLFRLFGLPPTRVAPAYEIQLQLFQPESRVQLDEAIQAASTDGTPYDLDLQLSRADGAAIWLLARGEAVRDAVGEIVKLVGTALDITEQKQVEVELQALNALKDDFLSTMSHELRTPLTSIKMAAHMLAVSLAQCQPSLPAVFGDPLAAKMSRYLAILQTECERELSLVNELLELQRLESGVVLPEWSHLQLLGWLPELITVYEARAHSRDLTLQLQVPESLPPLVSDAVLLTSVLRELLTNACKYTPPGGTIVVQAEQIDTRLQLSVSNTGSAIPPSELPRLFEKFYRSPGRDRWQQGGTGLGLALAKGQVEHLGGSLSVTSDAEQTVFRFELPLAP